MRATLLAVAFLFSAVATAAPYYQGPKRCQECHEAEHGVWSETTHAKSFKTVHKKKEAKKILAAVSDDKSMKRSPICTTCHYTLVQKSETSKASPRSGPSCESCHGASSNWLAIHNDFGGPNVKRDTETAAHKAKRKKEAAAAGMIWPSNRFDVAMNCMTCHGLAAPTVDGEVLSGMLEAGHPIEPDFELVQYSQGQVRHRFYPPDVTKNAELDKAGLAQLFIEGQAAKLVSATEAQARISKSANEQYKSAQNKRAADAKSALSKVKLPEAAALIENPTRQNARALVAAIAGKDMSGAVGALLPDPGSYK